MPTQAEISRRGLLVGLTAIIAAPAIVRATSLMPLRGIAMWPNWVPAGASVYADFIKRRFWYRGWQTDQFDEWRKVIAAECQFTGREVALTENGLWITGRANADAS